MHPAGAQPCSLQLHAVSQAPADCGAGTSPADLQAVGCPCRRYEQQACTSPSLSMLLRNFMQFRRPRQTAAQGFHLQSCKLRAAPARDMSFRIFGQAAPTARGPQPMTGVANLTSRAEPMQTPATKLLLATTAAVSTSSGEARQRGRHHQGTCSTAAFAHSLFERFLRNLRGLQICC